MKDEKRRVKGTANPEQTDSGEGISRRTALKTGVAGLAAALAGGGAVFVSEPAEAAGRGRSDSDDDSEGLVLVNGKIHTMDDRDRIVSSVAMRNGRFVAVGNAAGGGKVINLGGRTVVPGLIESHTHFVSLANRPGYHVAQLELASNIREVQETLAARRPDVPPGQFITAMGGFHTRQWAERRLPTLAELDEAVPDRPVFVFLRFSGPAVTNTLGKQFFETVSSPLAGPVAVDADGTLADARAGLYHLRVRQTFEDKLRSTLDAMAFTAQVGVTTNLDQVLVALARPPRDPQPGHFLANLDHYTMYDAWLALHREGKTFARLQMNFLHNQGNLPELGGLENQLPELRERLKNQFQFFGDDMMRTGAIGEWAAPFAFPSSPNYEVWFEAQRLVAQARWRNENSQAPEAGIEQVVETYEMMDQEFGIQELRWGLQHADNATEDQLARLKNLNCGVSMSGFRWQDDLVDPKDPKKPRGPFFPRIVESGIPAGLHEDGVHIAPHNPWFAIHYATTGLNYEGRQINSGQQITREQALYAYTRGNAWYLNRENDLGSIEEGKLADLVVLDKDYFTVSEAEMRNIRPVMTVIDGKVVHDARVPRRGKHRHDDDDDDDDRRHGRHKR